jgi:DtxR family Mn-dependent transcriptional regulator
MTLWILFAALLIVAALLPRFGLLPRYREWLRMRRKDLVEDALKHMLDCERQGRHASPESLAGTLGLARVKTTRLVTDMESQNLLASRGSELILTAEGERWALHVVRAHRLWERFLADEARMPLNRIHEEAHRREHRVTDEQLDALEASLGYPARDPHGDPIPRRDGTMASAEGTPLTAWQAEGPVRIVHLEDEPALAYLQIQAAGLHLGQTIRILERNSERIVLSDGENEYRLAPAVAGNVCVASLPVSDLRSIQTIPLSDLSQDQQAEIVELDEAVQGFTRRRFLDLGLTPGTVIHPELQNFFGDPRAYRVRGTLIALRKDQAVKIRVKPIN